MELKQFILLINICSERGMNKCTNKPQFKKWNPSLSAGYMPSLQWCITGNLISNRKDFYLLLSFENKSVVKNSKAAYVYIKYSITTDIMYRRFGKLHTDRLHSAKSVGVWVVVSLTIENRKQKPLKQNKRFTNYTKQEVYI